MGSHSAGRHSRQGSAPRHGTADRDAGRQTPPLGRRAVGPAATPAARFGGIPSRPPFGPPGEPDTITGPLSVSTTARRTREAAAPAGPGAGSSYTADGPYGAVNPYAAASAYDTDAPFSAGLPAAPGRPSADGTWDEDDRDVGGWDGGGWPSDARADLAGGRRVAVGGAAGATSARFVASARGQQFAGGSFTASRLPAARAGAGSSRPPRDPAAATRAPGAHRAPVRRGNGKVRLAAAGTVSLAGLSAIVAGVTLGGDPSGAAAAASAGDAPRVQYTGSPDVFSASQPAASRSRAQSTPPRAEPAPNADGGTGSNGTSTGSGQDPVTTTSLGPSTAPIPVITLVPRDDQPTTGPTDLRGLTPTASITAAATTTTAASPTAIGTTTTPSGTTGSPSPTSTPTAGGLPFDPASPASPAPSSAASLPFDPTPIPITPLHSTQPAKTATTAPTAWHASTSTGAATSTRTTTSTSASSATTPCPPSASTTTASTSTAAARPASTTGSFWSVH